MAPPAPSSHADSGACAESPRPSPVPAPRRRRRGREIPRGPAAPALRAATAAIGPNIIAPICVFLNGIFTTAFSAFSGLAILARWMRAAACDAPARVVRAPVMGWSSSSHVLIHQAVEMFHCKAPGTQPPLLEIKAGHVWRYSAALIFR